MNAWQVHTGPDGKIYYYNVVTQQSTWEKPVELQNPYDRALAQSSWREYTAEGGVKYWYNVVTKQSVWEPPEEVKAIAERYLNTLAGNGVPTDDFGGNNSVTSSGLYEYESKSSLADTSAFRMVTAEEGQRKFRELLAKYDVDETSTWAETMVKLIKDPLYFSVGDPLIRKQTFEDYVSSMKKEREEKLTLAKEAKVQALYEYFKKRGDISYFAKWRSIKDTLDKGLVKDLDMEEKDCRLVFTRYVRDLRLAHEAKQRNLRETELTSLQNLFDQLRVDVYTRWTDIRPELDKMLQANKLTHISHLDVLDAFQDLMRKLERELNTERQKGKRVFYRQERKARRAYVELLEDLRKQGKIVAKTKWTDIFPLIKEDHRYIAICGLPGSSPLELFWDIVEEEQRKLKIQTELVLDILAAKRKAIDATTTFDQFLNWIRSDHRGDDYAESLLTAIFENLYSQQKGRRASRSDAGEDRHAAERRLRRAQDDLRYYIKQLDPPVGIDETWEMVEPRVKNSPEYKALPDGASRLAAFDKYIRRLKERLEEKWRHSYDDHQYGRDGYRREYRRVEYRPDRRESRPDSRADSRPDSRYRPHDYSRYERYDHDREREKEREREQERRKWDEERIAKHQVSQRGTDIGPYLEY